MRRSLVVLALAVAASVPLQRAAAQAIPNITAAKSAATNAVAKTNAHTATVTGTSTAKSEPAQATPAKAAPAKSQPSNATTATKPAASTAAKSATKPAAKPDGKADSKSTPKPTLTETMSADQAKAARDTMKSGTTSIATRGAASEMTFAREVYSYPGTGRRDPFLSLLKSGDLRPLLSDLKLVTVLYDPTGRNSVAILRDLSTKDQYRVKVGQQLGRMRVVQIQPRQLVFTIEEFGYSRQEILALTDTNTETTR